jgi:hypothetical protein
MLLDKRYRSECHMNGIKVVFPAANRYDSLLKQRHIQVRKNVTQSYGQNISSESLRAVPSLVFFQTNLIFLCSFLVVQLI